MEQMDQNILKRMDEGRTEINKIKREKMYGSRKRSRLKWR